MDVAALRRIVEGMMSSLSVPTLRWATVVQASPLRIQYPIESEPLPFEPTYLGPKPGLGASVLTVQWGTRITILGAVGQQGTPFAGDMNTLIAGGTYQITSGAIGGPVPDGAYTGVVTETSSHVVQVLVGVDAVSGYRTYTRRYDRAGASWSGWRALDQDLLGARAVRNTAGPSVPASTYTKMAGFTSAEYDDGDESPIINLSTGAITIPVAGRWRITFSAPWRNYGSVYRRMLAIAAGTADATTSQKNRTEISTNERLYFSVSVTVVANAGDTFQAWMWSDTSSSGPETDAVMTALEVQQVK